RDRVNPASVPSTTAQQAEIAAIWTDSPAAPRIWAFDSNSPYQRSVGEWAASHTVTRRELLNENTMRDRIGTYRKTSPQTNTVRGTTPGDLISRPRPCAVRGAAAA